jgi:hypothetical protein
LVHSFCTLPALNFLFIVLMAFQTCADTYRQCLVFAASTCVKAVSFT